MSMLADRKRKQKWSLNPRGNDWSRDSNKFGKKLMERMGWKEGKGLGANEDGATDHVRVAYKNDIKGIGFKESIESSVQQDNFSALLSELNNGSATNETPSVVKSLEKKSEQSRARVHYRKFTRGKDLSRYSEKDLANILGRRKLQTNESQVEPENVSSQPSQFGVPTTTGGSMVDYFKNKLPNFMSARNKRRSDSEPEVAYGLGFNTSKVNDADSSLTPSRKKHKHSDAIDLELTPSVKKRNETSTESPKAGLINPAFDPLSRNFITSNRHVLETISEKDEHSPDCLKHEKLPDNIEIKQLTNKSSGDAQIDTCKANNKIKKKKDKDFCKIEQEGVNNPCFEIACNTAENSIETDGINSGKHKKRKRDKHIVAAIVESNMDVKIIKTKLNQTDMSDDLDSLTTNKNNRKNRQNHDSSETYDIHSGKKYKLSETESCFDNPGFTDSTLTPTTQNSYEFKPKKKSKKIGLENPCFNDDLNSTTSDNAMVISNEFEVKRKKCRGIDNLNFSANTSNNVSLDTNDVPIDKKVKRTGAEEAIIKLNSASEGKIKSKYKRKKSNNVILPECCEGKDAKEESIVNIGDEVSKPTSNGGIDNPALNLSDSLNIDDCDLILNITNEPIQVKQSEVKTTHKKVRFNKKGNNEYLFDEITDSSDVVTQRKELFEINTKVIASTSARYSKHQGVDNAAFNIVTSSVEESVHSLARSLENCQAEVENGINESKVTRVNYAERMIGEMSNLDGEDEPHPDGIIFRLKNANFSAKRPLWEMQNNVSAMHCKKSYKHLIQGDIVVGFRDTNLHMISGYGQPFKKRLSR